MAIEPGKNNNYIFTKEDDDYLVKFNGYGLYNFVESKPTNFNLTITNPTGCTVTANKKTGLIGTDIVTLSNSVSSGYKFGNYTFNGINIGSSFIPTVESGVVSAKVTALPKSVLLQSKTAQVTDGTIGGGVSLDADYPVWCIKVDYKVSSGAGHIWHKFSSNIMNGEWGRWASSYNAILGLKTGTYTSQNVSLINRDGAYRIRATTGSSPGSTFVTIKCIVDTKKNVIRLSTGSASAGSWARWTSINTSGATTFNGTQGDGDTSSYHTYMKNLYVYKCLDEATAISL